MTEKSVARREDDSPEGYLRLMQLPDQDIVVAVRDEVGRFAAVRFRELVVGGGMSPFTYEALINLFAAMEKDNRENRNNRAVD